eukprot:CAMPEP_0173203922 /NCGR_PEP_ID=MMETSP1141-20130122/19799_1 /TAXON_ID=483371 /ORGANISM="non described non described, Strain CCMP2298" /LENGTH=60 /DNA_ID=CAMNT_0014129455 /DNA_START=601 /DNA_END=781 /DNA_ORIENTATION=-
MTQQKYLHIPQKGSDNLDDAKAPINAVRILTGTELQASAQSRWSKQLQRAQPQREQCEDS